MRRICRVTRANAINYYHFINNIRYLCPDFMKDSI